MVVRLAVLGLIVFLGVAFEVVSIWREVRDAFREPLT
jgi:hypothetical protein